MLIRCPTCSSGYELPPDLLPAGRILRCAHCRDAWVHLADGAGAAPVASPGPGGRTIAVEARFSRSGAPVETRRAPRARRAGPAASFAPRLPAGAAAGLALAALLGGGWAAVAGRAELVGAFPPAEAAFALLNLPVNLRGLTLAADRSAVEAGEGIATLTVEGRITNLKAEVAAVPALRIAVRDKDGRELYHWIAPAPKSRLAAGETVAFGGRLVSPPPDGRSLAVSFADASAKPRRVAELLPGDR